MKTKTHKDIVTELSKKYGLSVATINKIVESPWRKMIDVVENIEEITTDETKYPMFYHVHVGTFKTSARRLNRLINIVKFEAYGTRNNRPKGDKKRTNG